MGDLGPSLRYRSQSVNDIVATTFPTSAQLGVALGDAGFVIGSRRGSLPRLKQNTWMDYTATFGAVIFPFGS